MRTSIHAYTNLLTCTDTGGKNAHINTHKPVFIHTQTYKPSHHKPRVERDGKRYRESSRHLRKTLKQIMADTRTPLRRQSVSQPVASALPACPALPDPLPVSVLQSPCGPRYAVSPSPGSLLLSPQRGARGSFRAQFAPGNGAFARLLGYARHLFTLGLGITTEEGGLLSGSAQF